MDRAGKQPIRAGLPVPNGFLIFPRAAEDDIRRAYEELTIREKTHFVAVRASWHAMLNVIPEINPIRRRAC